MDIKIQSIKNQIIYHQNSKVINKVNPAKKEQSLKKDDKEKDDKEKDDKNIDDKKINIYV